VAIDTGLSSDSKDITIQSSVWIVPSTWLSEMLHRSSGLWSDLHLSRYSQGFL